MQQQSLGPSAGRFLRGHHVEGGVLAFASHSVASPVDCKGVAAGGAVMIRGPRRGLGTFRCRCRCILLLPLLLLSLVAQLQCGAAVTRVPQRNKGTQAHHQARHSSAAAIAEAAAATAAAAAAAAAATAAAPHHQRRFKSNPFNVMAAVGNSAANGGGAAGRDTSVVLQNHPLHRQQQQQQTPTAIVPQHQTHAGYKSASSKDSALEASIIRLMNRRNWYLTILPNGNVTATSHDTYYSEYDLHTFACTLVLHEQFVVRLISLLFLLWLLMMALIQ